LRLLILGVSGFGGGLLLGSTGRFGIGLLLWLGWLLSLLIIFGVGVPRGSLGGLGLAVGPAGSLVGSLLLLPGLGVGLGGPPLSRFGRMGGLCFVLTLTLKPLSGLLPRLAGPLFRLMLLTVLVCSGLLGTFSLSMGFPTL
jgi:hypothetical protein